MKIEPEEFLNQYKSALATQNWEEVSPLIHEDACVVFSSGTHKGKREVKQAIEKNFALIKNETFSISNVHWVQKTDSFAVLLFNFHWSGLINENPAKGTGRGSSIIVKEKGKWQLLIEHLGPDVSTK